MEDNTMNRRNAIKTYALTALGLSLPTIVLANQHTVDSPSVLANDKIPAYFPNLNPQVISDVVGKSHFDFSGVQELVEKRPELAKSVWEWRFGDFESAIGAASHVGRRDIANYLIAKGARPTIFTFAMLGNFEAVKAMIKAAPGIHQTKGPHGISLLEHAYAGARMKDKMNASEIENLEQTIAYLAELENAGAINYLPVDEQEQKKYLGDYRYGTGETDGFTIGVNMRKLLSLAPLGGFGGALYKIDENQFTYNGAPSVTVSFNYEGDTVNSLTVSDPDFTVVAKKIT